MCIYLFSPGNSLPLTRRQASAAFSGQPTQFEAFQYSIRKVIRSPHLTHGAGARGICYSRSTFRAFLSRTTVF